MLQRQYIARTVRLCATERKKALLRNAVSAANSLATAVAVAFDHDILAAYAANQEISRIGGQILPSIDAIPAALACACEMVDIAPLGRSVARRVALEVWRLAKHHTGTDFLDISYRMLNTCKGRGIPLILPHGTFKVRPAATATHYRLWIRWRGVEFPVECNRKTYRDLTRRFEVREVLIQLDRRGGRLKIRIHCAKKLNTDQHKPNGQRPAPSSVARGRGTGRRWQMVDWETPARPVKTSRVPVDGEGTVAALLAVMWNATARREWKRRVGWQRWREALRGEPGLRWIVETHHPEQCARLRHFLASN